MNSNDKLATARTATADDFSHAIFEKLTAMVAENLTAGEAPEDTFETFKTALSELGVSDCDAALIFRTIGVSIARRRNIDCFAYAEKICPNI